MKKALLIFVPLLLLIGGTTVGLAMLGMVQVPFLAFGKKKTPRPPKDDGKGGPFASLVAQMESLSTQAEATKAAKPPVPPTPPPDTGPGEAKLAQMWAELPPDRLATIVDKWPAPQLGRILSQMDEEAVTNLLATLPPTRAANLSKMVADATDERASKVHPNS